MNSLRLSKTKMRGLDELCFRIGDITKEIEKRLHENNPVRILEVGCGYGVALLDIHLLYGDKVCLFGITRFPEHGNVQILKRIAMDTGLMTESEIEKSTLPEFLHFDVCEDWPIPSDSIDIVFSQHAFLWFEDKIKPLEEINRVLKHDGIGLLDLSIRASGPLKKSSIIVQRANNSESFWNYIKQFDNINIKPDMNTANQIKSFLRKIVSLVKIKKASRHRPRIEMRKKDNFSFNLSFVSSTPFSEISPGRKGCQSIYKTKEI